MRPLATHRTSRRTAVTTMITPLLLVVLAACGEPAAAPGVASADGGATPSATPSNADQKADPIKFAQCMREHGIQMEDPTNGKVHIRGRPGDERKLTEAQEACRHYLPSEGEGDGKAMPKADQERFLRFAQCMRDRGIPMADPKFEGGGVKMMIEGKGPRKMDEGKVQAAHKACSSLLPDGGPDGDGPGGGSGTTSGGDE